MRLNFQEQSELKIQSRNDPAIGGISGLYQFNIKMSQSDIIMYKWLMPMYI
jgi:hypothetical protein